MLGFHVAGSTGNSRAGSLASLALAAAMLIPQAVFSAQIKLAMYLHLGAQLSMHEDDVHEDSSAELGKGWGDKVRDGGVGVKVRCMLTFMS